MACASSNKNKVKREGGGKLEGTIFNSSQFQKKPQLILEHPSEGQAEAKLNYTLQFNKAVKDRR